MRLRLESRRVGEFVVNFVHDGGDAERRKAVVEADVSVTVCT